MLGDDAIISPDFGGKSNNTDILETLRSMADASREYISEHGPIMLATR
jgi:hypothetical protein